jgi:hypothetical protein
MDEHQQPTALLYLPKLVRVITRHGIYRTKLFESATGRPICFWPGMNPGPAVTRRESGPHQGAAAIRTVAETGLTFGLARDLDAARCASIPPLRLC